MTRYHAIAIEHLRTAIERNPQRLGYTTIRTSEAALILEWIDARNEPETDQGGKDDERKTVG